MIADLATDVAVRQPLRLRPDATRVITKLFVPGHPDPQCGRQVTDAVSHILALDEDEACDGVAELVERFGARHRDLTETFRHHADRVANRVPDGADLSEGRRMLLGAAFTHEYSVEAAALCNPSAVLAPDQRDAARGSADLVLSVRQIGEGHRSSTGFRSVSVDAAGVVTAEPAGRFTTAGTVGTSTLHSDAFLGLARRMRDDVDATRWVLDRLGDEFTHGELDARLADLEAQADTRPTVAATARRLRALAARAYRVEFSESSELSERVLYPATAAEANGVEDARFVRFHDGGDPVYYGTYTAYDGATIVQQLLETTDFRSFESSPLQGPAARNKGLALFPRRIDGRFAAMSRYDGATNAVAFSTNLRHWPTATPIAERPKLRTTIQVGNCGAPMETDAGWLVLTHGVGPMRTYSIGAVLLDLDDPTVAIGELARPLLSPQPDEQDGYVPNVVYSCGGVIHGPNLVIPFGIGDASIGFASVGVADLLAEMQSG